MATEPTFHFEVEKSEDKHKLPLTTIKTHGRLTAGGTGPLKELVKSLLDAGGQHVVIDCSELESIDSSGLGTLVGLKVSAISKGLSKLELVNLSPRVAALLKLTNLGDLLTTEYR
jgi:anti-sigma B factor antagonist